MYLDAIGNIADVTHDQYHAVVCDQVIFNSWQFVVNYVKQVMWKSKLREGEQQWVSERWRSSGHDLMLEPQADDLDSAFCPGPFVHYKQMTWTSSYK